MAKRIEHASFDWDIVSAHYESGHFYLKFHDGSQGKIPVAEFPALAAATESDFESLQVSPCGLILEVGDIEWDYAEAGLYGILNGQAVRDAAQQRYLERCRSERS